MNEIGLLLEQGGNELLTARLLLASLPLLYFQRLYKEERNNSKRFLDLISSLSLFLPPSLVW